MRVFNVMPFVGDSQHLNPNGCQKAFETQQHPLLDMLLRENMRPNHSKPKNQCFCFFGGRKRLTFVPASVVEAGRFELVFWPMSLAQPRWELALGLHQGLVLLGQWIFDSTSAFLQIFPRKKKHLISATTEP